jgi:thiol-disulfide isomerase/thioredoxin
MNLKAKLTSILFFFSWIIKAQSLSGIYKTDQLLGRINQPDTLYIVNFWAMWCKPCIEELPDLDSLCKLTKGRPIKVLLVNVDFKEKRFKVDDFLKKKELKAECVLLDEINGNNYIDKVSPSWSGSIPATLFRKNGKHILYEKKMTLPELKNRLEENNR